MPATSLLARSGLWRVTRHAAVRRWYDALAARGLFLAQLDRFERSVGDGTSPALPRPPEDVDLGVVSATERLPDRLQSGPVAPGDLVVLARRHGEPVGHCCLSERPVYVPELRRRLRPPGTYCWRLYVRPRARGEGVGRAIVAAALRRAASDDSGGTGTEPGRRSDASDTVSALVAPDNLPSRRVFESLGFRPTVRYTAAGVPGRTWHRRRRLG